MSKKVDAYKCDTCGRMFPNEEDAKHENHSKKVKSYGDPIVELH